MLPPVVQFIIVAEYMLSRELVFWPISYDHSEVTCRRLVCFQKYLKEAKKASKALLAAEKGPAKAAPPASKGVLDRFKKKPL